MAWHNDIDDWYHSYDYEHPLDGKCNIINVWIGVILVSICSLIWLIFWTYIGLNK